MIDQALVTKWLDQEAIDFAPAVELREPEKFAWAILMSPKGLFSSTVAARAVEWSDLSIELNLGIAESHREALSALPPKIRERFLFDLRIALLERPIGHVIELPESPPLVPLRVTIGCRIFEEPITRAGFFRRHHQVQSAALIAATMIQKIATLGE
jgi:hypothetical protein